MQWIESESGWGQSSEGYKLFSDKEEMFKDFNKKRGGDYYIGPVRPNYYVEIPYDALDLDEKGKEVLDRDGCTFSDKYWSPKYKSEIIRI